MKKILILSVLIFLSAAQIAHSACLLEDLKKNESCTGGAAGIGVNTSNEALLPDQTQNDRQDLIRIYQIPTLSYPLSIKNGFPVLNPAANCAFGMCQPR